MVQALYGEVLRLPAHEFASVGTELRGRREEVLRRLGIALLAARPTDDADGVHAVISDPGRWDHRNSTTRDEFRALCASALPVLDEATRRGLITYVVTAADINERYDEAFAGQDDAPSRTQMVQDWRSLYLGAVASGLTEEEAEAVGPLSPPETPTRRRRRGVIEREPSPISSDDMAAKDPAEVVSFLLSWQSSLTFAGADKTTVAAELKVAVAGSPARWAEALAHGDRRLPLVYAYQAIEGLRSALGDGAAFELGYAVDWLTQVVGDRSDDRDGWRTSVERAALTLIEDAVKHTPAAVTSLARPIADLVISLIGAPEGEGVFLDSANVDLLTESLNSTPGEAIDVGARLVYALAERSGAEARRLVEALDAQAVAQRSPVISASFGRALPWLVSVPGVQTTDLVDHLLAPDDPASDLVWGTYVLAWSPINAVVVRTADFYARAARAAGEDQPVGRRPVDPRERLGQHLVKFDLRQTVPEAHAWLIDFYESAPDSILAHTTRFVADHLRLEDLTADAAGRAIDILAGRSVAAGPAEAHALGWASRTVTRPSDILVRVLKPAAARFTGTDDPGGVMSLLARDEPYACRDVAVVLRSVIDGDRYEALPHIAGDDLKVVLRRFLSGGDPACRRSAKETIDRLGAQGFAEYGSLLDEPGAG